MGDLVTVARCYGAGEAAVIWSLLDQHGIYCVRIGANHLTAQPQLMIAMQGIELRVAEEDVPDVLALLAHASTDETYEMCPACGSSRVFRQASYLNLLFCLVLGMLGGLAALVMTRPTARRYCHHCRHWWRAEKSGTVAE